MVNLALSWDPHISCYTHIKVLRQRCDNVTSVYPFVAIFIAIFNEMLQCFVQRQTYVL